MSGTFVNPHILIMAIGLAVFCIACAITMIVHAYVFVANWRKHGFVAALEYENENGQVPWSVD